MKRRNLLKLLASGTVFLTGIIKPLAALAKWNQEAFDATNYDDAIKHYFPDTNFEDTDKITIGVLFCPRLLIFNPNCFHTHFICWF